MSDSFAVVTRRFFHLALENEERNPKLPDGMQFLSLTSNAEAPPSGTVTCIPTVQSTATMWRWYHTSGPGVTGILACASVRQPKSARPSSIDESIVRMPAKYP